MNRLQYLLIKLAEEASEVSQIALKTSQFGLEEKHPEMDETNKERIHKELNDLLGIVKMLNLQFEFSFTPSEVEINQKMAKVNHYYRYSKECGAIHEDDESKIFSAPTPSPSVESSTLNNFGGSHESTTPNG
jgi:NTP pyrophosphatase (non-canonical NTP hydrolase)